MFQVLVVDDNEHKRQKIAEIIETLCGGGELVLDNASDANTSLQKLREVEYDLVILDVYLPLRPDDQPRREGGVLVLDAIYRQKGGLKRPKRIVGMTAYPDVREEVEAKFSVQGVVLIPYSGESESWTAALSNIVSYEFGRGESPETAEFIEDACIITALKGVELEAVLRLPCGWQREEVDGDETQYFRGGIDGAGGAKTVIAAGALEMGMPAAACLAMKMIYTFRPRYLCMCGITAGFGANMGDIVVAERAWDCGSGKYRTNEDGTMRFEPEPRQIVVAESVAEKIGVYITTQKDAVGAIQARWQGNPQERLLKASLGPVASGAAVIENQEIMNEIKGQNRKVAAVEMEAYGLFMAARVCSRPRPEVVVVKAVCDCGAPPKTDEHQRYAAYTSAAYLRAILSDCLP